MATPPTLVSDTACVACDQLRTVEAVCSTLCLTRLAHDRRGQSSPTSDRRANIDTEPIDDDHAARRVDAYPPWEHPAGRERYLCHTCGYLTADDLRTDARHTRLLDDAA